MSEKRNYSYSDSDMCLTAQTIAKSFSSNLGELAVYRTNWTPKFAKNLMQNIDDTMKKYLGIDPKKGLRDATALLGNLMEPAKKDLSIFKTMVDTDFKNKSKIHDEILLNLGITKHLSEVQQNDQLALINLLFAFRKNMTAPLKADITAKGMNPDIIDRIVGYGDIINAANLNQESLKGTTKEISKEGAEAMNALYDEMIGICKLASKHFKNDPLKKALFTFSKVHDQMTPGRVNSETQVTDA